MPTSDELKAIRNDNIQYVTYTHPDDYGQIPPEMFRQVGVSAPPEAVALIESGDLRAFDVLLPMLDDPDRNWAAFVILVALTGTQAETVTMFEHAKDFQGSNTQVKARKEWEEWLAKFRAQLHWSPKRKQFRLHAT